MSATRKPVKVGQPVNLKNYDGLSSGGVVTLVVGDGPTADHQIRTVDGYVWRFRDQFTLTR